MQAKDLVAYFSAQGNTKAVAERIAELTGADIYRIEAADPYASNPYDDSDRIQNEAYNDLRPGVANLPSQEWISQYDRIFIGSPCWWHQPAMVVCTFLESYDLSKQIIIPFFTYGATTYLNESMQKIYKCTPNSLHVPEALPEDLDADDITRPGRPDDAGIDMPGNARGVEGWLSRLGLTGNTAIAEPENYLQDNVRIYNTACEIHVELDERMSPNTVEIYNVNGTLLHKMSDKTNYSFSVPAKSVYLFSMVYGSDNKCVNKKIVL
jgi:flavodoxin